MPLADERRIGIKFNSSVRKANAIARKIDALLASELGEDYDIRTDGFRPSEWATSDVSVSFRGERTEAQKRTGPRTT